MAEDAVVDDAVSEIGELNLGSDSSLREGFSDEVVFELCLDARALVGCVGTFCS